MKIKLFACFVLFLPFRFIYILVYLVIAFPLRLKSVKTVFNILFFPCLLACLLACLLPSFLPSLLAYLLTDSLTYLLTYLLTYRGNRDYSKSFKWTYNLDKDLYECHTKSKSDPRIGYMNQMKTILG